MLRSLFFFVFSKNETTFSTLSRSLPRFFSFLSPVLFCFLLSKTNYSKVVMLQRKKEKQRQQ